MYSVDIEGIRYIFIKNEQDIYSPWYYNPFSEHKSMGHYIYCKLTGQDIGNPRTRDSIKIMNQVLDQNIENPMISELIRESMAQCLGRPAIKKMISDIPKPVVFLGTGQINDTKQKIFDLLAQKKEVVIETGNQFHDLFFKELESFVQQ